MKQNTITQCNYFLYYRPIHFNINKHFLIHGKYQMSVDLILNLLNYFNKIILCYILYNESSINVVMPIEKH